MLLMVVHLNIILEFFPCVWVIGYQEHHLPHHKFDAFIHVLVLALLDELVEQELLGDTEEQQPMLLATELGHSTSPRP